MKIVKNKKLILLFIVIILTLTLVKNVEAGCQSHKIFGYAWSENIGWISFSCGNCDNDFNGNLDGGSCGNGSSVDYGVDVDQNGILSGYAWSENIGWISFADFDGDGDVDENDKKILGSPCAPNCQAAVNLTTNEVSGWARALVATSGSGGWNGWIKLKGTIAGGTPYGVILNKNVNPNEFEKWAWGGDDNVQEAVIGWVSFNRVNCDTDKNGFSNGQGSCPAIGTPISNYKVSAIFNFPPTATDLKVVTDNYCNCISEQNQECFGSTSNPPIILTWTFIDSDGDSQKFYQIQINNNSNFNSPLIDSNKVKSDSNSYTPLSLNFNTQYYWRVKVWDTNGNESDWINGPNFKTDIRWPNTNFSFDPLSPPAEVQVNFTDESTCYNSDISNYICSTYNWNFGDGSISIDKGDTKHTYSTSRDYYVVLKVTDQYNHMCPAIRKLKVTLPLPIWKEISPF